ncbi:MULTISPECIES: hypothetical protein [unclassified Streptomyces]|uniref:hypothetical protein n=1 Tax=unclassified Streptomyces TaxID=2593676 RepID=UPI00380220D0
MGNNIAIYIDAVRSCIAREDIDRAIRIATAVYPLADIHERRVLAFSLGRHITRLPGRGVNN